VPPEHPRVARIGLDRLTLQRNPIPGVPHLCESQPAVDSGVERAERGQDAGQSGTDPVPTSSPRSGRSTRPPPFRRSGHRLTLRREPGPTLPSIQSDCFGVTAEFGQATPIIESLDIVIPGWFSRTARTFSAGEPICTGAQVVVASCGADGLASHQRRACPCLASAVPRTAPSLCHRQRCADVALHRAGFCRQDKSPAEADLLRCPRWGGSLQRSMIHI
jgi:hypothetical protein